MIFNEIKCHVNTCLGLVGGACIPCIPPLCPRLRTTVQSHTNNGYIILMMLLFTQ